jgi:hypothetical protein
MALARTCRTMITAGLFFLVVACGVSAPQNGTAALGAGGSPAGAGQAGELKFGTEHRFATGLTVSVAPPKSFRPSPAAYPSSPRAAAFDIDVVNAGADTYKLSGLSVTATNGGVPVKQVVDTTQGFSGIADAGKDVLPGHSVQFTLAFAVPERETQLTLLIRPAAGDEPAVTYCGPA